MLNFLERIFLFLLTPVLIFLYGDSTPERPTPHHPHVRPPSNHPFNINDHLPSTSFSPRPNISEPLFAELEELARIVDIAYCVGYSGIKQPFQCLSRCDEFPTFQLIKTFNTGPLLSDSCGYVALSHPPAAKRIVVAFRGTYSIANAIADLSLGKQEYLPYPSDGHDTSPGAGAANEEKCEGCTVHQGFLESWTQAEKVIGPTIDELVSAWAHRGYRLTLVGHSLGGAVAGLAALEFAAKGYRPVVTTFGEPKLGNDALAAYVDRKFDAATYRRVTHVDDPVPLLPMTEWGFAAHDHELYIAKASLPPAAKDVLRCDGVDDPECIAGGRMNVFQLFWAHRDYFHRLGVCLPDPRRVWDNEEDGRDEGILPEGGVGGESDIWAREQRAPIRGGRSS